MTDTDTDFDLKKYDRTEDFPGKIPECPTTGCGFKCCKFNHGNYIVMYPGELEAELEKGLSSDHLELIDDDYLGMGGKKVVCKRLCEGNDIKPLDCKIYPLWYKGEREDGSDHFISGKKCPLSTPATIRHAILTKHHISKLIDGDPKLADFFLATEMVGYEDLDKINLEEGALRNYLLDHEADFATHSALVRSDLAKMNTSPEELAETLKQQNDLAFRLKVNKTLDR